MKKLQNDAFEEKVERLITISKEKPLIPEEYVPWDTVQLPEYVFLPPEILSLSGTIEFDSLTEIQKRELGRHEVGQVMHSYAWSEGLACLFIFRHLVTLKDTTSAEYRYLLIEAQEECRHQQMFSMAIKTLGVTPLPPRVLHRLAARFATRWLPADMMFMSVLAIEFVTDVYGTKLRQGKNIFPVLAKVSTLHNIEEGRHIRFTELLLDRYIQKAGPVKRSLYSIVMCLNIYFMRTMYVRKEIFKSIGVDPQKYYPAAYRGLRDTFGKECLGRALEFVHSFKGLNWCTRLFWRMLLGAKI